MLTWQMPINIIRLTHSLMTHKYAASTISDRKDYQCFFGTWLLSGTKRLTFSGGNVLQFLSQLVVKWWLCNYEKYEWKVQANRNSGNYSELYHVGSLLFPGDGSFLVIFLLKYMLACNIRNQRETQLVKYSRFHIFCDRLKIYTY